MSRLRIQLMAAAALAAAALAGGTAAPAWAAARPHVTAQIQARPDAFAAEDYGTGPTAAAAEHAAIVALHGDYSGCNTPVLVYDTLVNGTWFAEVAAACTGDN